LRATKPHTSPLKEGDQKFFFNRPFHFVFDKGRVSFIDDRLSYYANNNRPFARGILRPNSFSGTICHHMPDYGYKTVWT